MRSMLTACLITCALAPAGMATAQAQYLSKPVRLIVPLPPGGGPDTLALDATGIEPIGTTPEQFAAYIRGEIDKWTKVVRAAGIRAG